ncbi:MAG: PAS domain-containing protein, partial [Syntrophales bacterium]
MKRRNIQVIHEMSLADQILIKDNAIKSSINAIAFGDLKGNIIYVNDAFLHLWGSDDPSEILGKPAVTLAESQDEAEKILQIIIEKGRWFGEIMGIRKDGSRLILQLSANLVKSDREEPVGLMCSFVDVTQHKHMEEELLIKSNAIQTAMYGIALGDLNGNVTYVNNAGLPFWGTDDLSEIIGKPAVSFARSEKEGLEILQSVLEKGSWFGEVTGLRKDGTPIPVELSASIFRNDQGVPIGLMSSYVDITERKRAEQELRIKSDAIQTAINGIGFTDLSGNITSINDAGLHIWGAD